MNKEKEIEEMESIITQALDRELIDRFIEDADGNLARIETTSTREIASALVTAGYGNVKLMVREFAAKLKKEIICGDGTCLDEYDAGFQAGYNSACKEHKTYIDDLITKLYGADK